MNEWFEVEVAFRFKPDVWNKTYRFDRGPKSEFDTPQLAAAHIQSMRDSTDTLYNDAHYRVVRYSREVLSVLRS